MIQLNFLFWFILVGLVVGSLQDLKRREIDNWLNLLLLFGGFGFLAFSAIFNLDGMVMLMGVVSFVFLYLVRRNYAFLVLMYVAVKFIQKII